MGKKLSKQDKLKIIYADFELYAKNFIKIVDNNGQEIPFVLNKQQKYLYDNFDKYTLILKSRQIGFTTYSLAYCVWIAATKPNSTCMILCYNVESCQNLFEKCKAMYESIPDEYKPKQLKNNKNELKLDNGSRIVLKVANEKLGRSFTCEFILCSEYAFFSDVAQTKGLLGLEQALAKNPDSKLIIESTANSFNHFRQLFENAQKGNSKYKAFFFNWFENKDLFKTEYQIAEAWYKADNHGCRLQEKDLDKYELGLYKKGCLLKQLCWRRYKLLDLTLDEFYQEYPSSPSEAFISTSKSVFDIHKIILRLDNLEPPLSKDEVDIEIPELLKPYLAKDKGLFLYHLPKANKRYYGGVDTASGSGADSSTISIFNDEGEQVATFCRNDIPIYKFAGVVNALGRWYGYAFLVVERNSYGLPLLERLRKEYSYLNLYKQKIFDQYGKKKMQLGWTTSSVTKAILVSDFKEQFEENMILLNDRETLEQMQIFEERDNGSTGNKKGLNFHDDMVVASALGVQAIKAKKYYI